MYDPADPFHKLPNVSDVDYIVLLWNEVGMIGRGGMSTTPLTWQEVAAFSMFNPIDKFEASMIIAMSRAFVDGVGMTDVNDKAPYSTEMTHEDMLARERSIEMQMNI
ncbi:hypothetical protein NVP1151O_17 [Vibrio phage 1.151.O._10N.222.46.B1]|nr:hypothetical protein NVP1151O_17 [Vibrio phage 1.151.O._10N.222.46.B1]